MVKNSKIKKQQGFTLLEMLISITLFSLVMVVALTAVLTIIDLNRKTQSLASVTNSMNAATDSMVRLIKSGERGFAVRSATTCDGSSQTQLDFEFYDTEEIFASPPAIHEVSYIYRCADEAIYREIGDDGRYLRITPQDVRITNVVFDLTDVCQDRVNIFIEGNAGDGRTASDFVIQTAATRRGVVGGGSC